MILVNLSIYCLSGLLMTMRFGSLVCDGRLDTLFYRGPMPFVGGELRNGCFGCVHCGYFCRDMKEGEDRVQWTCFYGVDKLTCILTTQYGLAKGLSSAAIMSLYGARILSELRNSWRMTDGISVIGIEVASAIVSHRIIDLEA